MRRALITGSLLCLLGLPQIVSPKPATQKSFSDLLNSDEWKAVSVMFSSTHDPRVAHCLAQESKILLGVMETYAQAKISLLFLKHLTLPLSPSNIAVSILSEDEYLATVQHGTFISSFSYGFAEPDARRAYAKIWDQDIGDCRTNQREFALDMQHTIAHEIGHVLMLPHTSTIEPSQDGCVNVMDPKYDPSSHRCISFSDSQIRLMHSFLSHGDVFERYVRAGSYDKYLLEYEKE